MLAAGRGSRFDASANKLLVPWQGKPLLSHVLDRVVEARDRGLIRAGVVIIRPDEPETPRLASAAGLLPVVAHDAAAGLSASLRTGLAALERHAEADSFATALVLLGDQPAVSAAAIEAVIAAGRGSRDALARARYRGAPDAPGHPVLIGRHWWPLARELSGDRGLDRLLSARGAAWTEVWVEGDNPDVDTTHDLRRLDRS